MRSYYQAHQVRERQLRRRLQVVRAVLIGIAIVLLILVAASVTSASGGAGGAF